MRDIERILLVLWTSTMHCSYEMHHHYLNLRKAMARGSGTKDAALPKFRDCRIEIFRRDYHVKIRQI